MNFEDSGSVKICNMTPADIEPVLSILAENRLENWSRDDFTFELERADSILLIGQIKTIVVGFCVSRLITCFGGTIIRQHDGIEPNGDENFPGECEIYNIAVKRRYQKRGIGYQLLNGIVTRANENKAESIWLEVRSTNIEAIGFYKRNSFERVYERKNFYSNPIENAIVMRRSLKSNFSTK